MGRVDVDNMLSEMTPKEFLGWQVYYSIEPFGEERADLRSGIISATIANSNRNKKTKPYTPENFMPSFGGKKQQTVEEQMAIMKAWEGVFKKRKAKNKEGIGNAA